MLSRLSFLCSGLGFDSKTSILGFIIFLLFWLIFIFPRNRNFELSKLPGPKPYPLLGNINIALLPRTKVFQEGLKIVRQYGDVFVLWVGRIPSVFISNPTYFQEVLHSSTHLSKGHTYKFVQSFLGAGLVTSSGSKWQKHRKIITPAFHLSILERFFDIFKENLNTLLKLLDEKADEGKVFDIYMYVNNYAMDNICEAAMGVKVDSQKEIISEYSSNSLRMTELMRERIQKFWLHSDFIYNMTSNGKEFKKRLAMAYDFVDKVIEERRNILQKKSQNKDATPDVDDLGMKKRLAFLDLLLMGTQDAISNLEDIRDEVNTFMFAGHDTTTTTITWALHLIGLHPEIQEELYLEQREIFGDDMERPIMTEDLSKMKFLDRVMKESIRLFPSVPIIGRQLDSDVQFGEYTVPAGTTVALHIFSMHRNPSIYPNPEKFDPDRFLPENVAQRHNYAYIPFSAGPRNCIGKRFALLQETLTIAALIRRYEIRSAEKTEDLKLISELILRSHTGIKVTLKKRVHN